MAQDVQASRTSLGGGGREDAARGRNKGNGLGLESARMPCHRDGKCSTRMRTNAIQKKKDVRRVFWAVMS